MGRQGGRNTISVWRLSENPTRPFGGLVLADYAKPYEMPLTQEKGPFDRAAKVTFISRSYLSLFFIIQGL